MCQEPQLDCDVQEGNREICLYDVISKPIFMKLILVCNQKLSVKYIE